MQVSFYGEPPGWWITSRREHWIAAPLREIR